MLLGLLGRVRLLGCVRLCGQVGLTVRWGLVCRVRLSRLRPLRLMRCRPVLRLGRERLRGRRPRRGRKGPGLGRRGDAVPGRAQVLRTLRRGGLGRGGRRGGGRRGGGRFGHGLRGAEPYDVGPRGAVTGARRAERDRPLGRRARRNGLHGGPAAPVPHPRQRPAGGRVRGERCARVGRRRGPVGFGCGLPGRIGPVDPVVPFAAEPGLARGVGLPHGGRLPRARGGFARSARDRTRRRLPREARARRLLCREARCRRLLCRGGSTRAVLEGGLLLVEEDRARLLSRGVPHGGRGRGGRGAARTGDPGGAVPVADVPGDGGVGVVALARAFVTGCRGWRAHQRVPYLFEATGRPRCCGRTASIQGSTSIRQPPAPGPVRLFGPLSGPPESFFEKSRHSWRAGRSLLVRDGHGTGP